MVCNPFALTLLTEETTSVHWIYFIAQKFFILVDNVKTRCQNDCIKVSVNRIACNFQNNEPQLYVLLYSGTLLRPSLHSDNLRRTIKSHD
jgi:hypothetical protein